MTEEQQRFRQFMLDKHGVHVWWKWDDNSIMVQIDPANPGHHCGKSMLIIVAVAWEAWQEAVQYNPTTGKRRWRK